MYYTLMNDDSNRVYHTDLKDFAMFGMALSVQDEEITGAYGSGREDFLVKATGTFDTQIFDLVKADSEEACVRAFREKHSGEITGGRVHMDWVKPLA